MLPGPVFYVELLMIARRKRYFALRLLYGFMLLYIFWTAFPRYGWYGVNADGFLTIQQAALIGNGIFVSLAFLQASAILLLTPALTAGVIADEKQRKTLHYLLASCLTSSEIVLGKLASRLLSALVIVLLTFPVLVIVTFVGGVDPNDVLLLTAASFSTLFLLGAFSICVSVHARKVREALVLAYVTEMVWLLGPSLVKNLAPWSQVEFGFLVVPFCDWIGATSPLFVLTEGRRFLFGGSTSGWYEDWFWMIGLQLVVATLLTFVAVVRLRPVYRAEGAKAKARARWRFRILPRPECRDDPIWWKERIVSRHGVAARVLGMLLMLTFLVFVGYWAVTLGEKVVEEILTNGYFVSTEQQGHLYFNAFVRTGLTSLLVVWQVAAATSAAAALASERDEDTWISLIATPLTPGEIVRGKWLGALYSTWSLALVWAAILLLGTALGAVHPLGCAFTVITTAVYVAFSTSLGLFYSLRAKTTTRAQIATIATLFMCNGVYLFCCIPFATGPGNGWAFIFAGVTPFIGAMSPASYQDIHWLAGQGPSWATHYGEMLLAGAFSVVLYGGAAAGLTTLLISGFDDAIDRPRTDGSGKVRRRRAPTPLPDSAIRFLEDEDIVKSKIPEDFVVNDDLS